MGGVMGAVIGIAEIAAGVFVSWAGGEALISMGVSELLGYAASLLANPHRSTLLPIGAAYTGTFEPPAAAPETLEQIAAVYLRE